MSPVILRDFTCSVCGAPRTTNADAVVVLCDHCGALLTSAGDADDVWVDAADKTAESTLRFVKPSRASARLVELATAMATATDRATWRRLYEEQLLLMPVVYPKAAPALSTDPSKRADQVKSAVAVAEIAQFDPLVASRMRAFTASCGKLPGAADPIASAREMLDAARAYWCAMLSHPELPAATAQQGADHQAKELVRSALAGYAVMLGDRVTERIRVQVLGDRVSTEEAASCARCGGPLPPGGPSLTRCPHCGAVTRVQSGDEDDAWMTSHLGLWRVTLDQLLRGDRLDAATAVTSAIGSLLYTGAASVGGDKALRFLARAIPWVTLAELEQGIQTLGLGVDGDPAKSRLLDAIVVSARRDWRADPSAKPSRRKPRFHPPPTEADEAAWVESTLALWAARPSTRLVDLLGWPLGAMLTAAMSDLPAGVSPRAAMTFFERAIPGYDRAAMHLQLVRIMPGYDQPRVADFMTGLAALLSARTPR